jgi:hypothetical protein
MVRAVDESRATPGTLTPFQQHLLRRLDHLLTVAAPAAGTRWQQVLLTHALRHTLAECNQAGLGAMATARLRQRGQRLGSPDRRADS